MPHKPLQLRLQGMPPLLPPIHLTDMPPSDIAGATEPHEQQPTTPAKHAPTARKATKPMPPSTIPKAAVSAPTTSSAAPTTTVALALLHKNDDAGSQ